MEQGQSRSHTPCGMGGMEGCGAGAVSLETTIPALLLLFNCFFSVSFFFSPSGNVGCPSPWPNPWHISAEGRAVRAAAAVLQYGLAMGGQGEGVIPCPKETLRWGKDGGSHLVLILLPNYGTLNAVLKWNIPMHSKERAVGCTHRCCAEGFRRETVLVGIWLAWMISEALSSLVTLRCSEGDAGGLPSPIPPPLFILPL